jgi:alkylhydroperoxidase/carboxymuconolactone decarboxylase family protein YurZ
MTDEMNDLLQAVAAEWGQGSQEHNIARDVCKLANKEIEALTSEIERKDAALQDMLTVYFSSTKRIEALTAENELSRKALGLIALGSIIELDDEDVPVQVWLDDEDMRSIARAALEKQP